MIRHNPGDQPDLDADLVIEEGDIFHGLCCPGYDFTVAIVIASVFGFCANPEHGDDTSLEIFDEEDIALFMAGERWN